MFKPTTLPWLPDWYEVTASDLNWGSDWAVPGIKMHAKLPAENRLIHRTHLPLLETSEASRICTERQSGDWSARDDHTASLGFKLRTTQQSALDYIEPRRGVLLGDDMRLGKSLVGVMAHDPKRGPLVIVAPLSTRAVWIGWLKRAYPDTPIAICVGRKIDKDLLKYPIIFIHWDLIKSWQVLMPIGTLVFDEAQAITNRNSLRSKAAGLLASRAEKVIAATGTPIQDRPRDLWNIIGMLAPGAWGSYYDFGYRYGAPVQTAYGVDFPGLSNADELKARLSEIMIRRLWKDVQDDLPPISRNIVIADIDDATRRKLDVLAGKLKSEKSNTAGNLAHYRSQLCKTKLKTVVAEIRKCVDREEPVVVWTWHKEFAKLIQTELASLKVDAESVQAHLIHGEISPDKREAILDAWKAAPADVLIATMAVAQVGIDLSHAHLAIFAEIDYQPTILAQAEMRTYSPLRSMNITFIVGNHIIDQRIVRALVSKLGSSDPVGLGAAVDAIDALRDAIDGPRQDPDMDRFLDDLLANVA